MISLKGGFPTHGQQVKHFRRIYTPYIIEKHEFGKRSCWHLSALATWVSLIPMRGLYSSSLLDTWVQVLVYHVVAWDLEVCSQMEG